MRPVYLRSDLGRNAPLAAALLGYCDGRLGLPASPPKAAAPYMREYSVGSRRALRQQRLTLVGDASRVLPARGALEPSWNRMRFFHALNGETNGVGSGR